LWANPTWSALTGSGLSGAARVRRPVPGSAFVAERPSHPETCPQCGKLTWNWKWLQSRQWYECDQCGFSGKASSTPGFKRA